MKTLNMLWLYPDMFDLHGDRGNMFAFEKTAARLGIQLNIKRVNSYEDKIDFDNTDIILLSPGETVVCERASEVLLPVKSEIEKYIQSGKLFVVIGNSLSTFATKTVRRDGSSFAGLGIVDVLCEELRTAYSNDAVFTTDAFGDELEVVGGQIQMLRFILGEGETPFGKTVYGYGNRRGGDEGVIKNGFIHTNLLGPVFVKNPWFAAKLLIKALGDDSAEAKETYEKIKESAFELERISNEEIKRFIDKKVKNYDKTRLDNDL